MLSILKTAGSPTDVSSQFKFYVQELKAAIKDCGKKQLKTAAKSKRLPNNYQKILMTENPHASTIAGCTCRIF